MSWRGSNIGKRPDFLNLSAIFFGGKDMENVIGVNVIVAILSNGGWFAAGASRVSPEETMELLQHNAREAGCEVLDFRCITADI